MRIAFWSLLLWLFVRIFIFQSFQIPSSSMHPTLVEGDHIFVNKLAYGARIPITPLSLPIGKTYIDWIQIPYLRLPGFSSVKRNDIIVFNYPMEDEAPIDEKKEYVKRCIGLPGDTIKIKNGIVTINHELAAITFEPLYKYHVLLKSSSNKHILKNYEGYFDFQQGTDFYINITSKNIPCYNR